MNGFHPAGRGGVATLTTNPAIDQTVSLDILQPGKINRAHAMRFDAGGKGVIVAQRLADYGVPTAVTGFLGRNGADLFEHTFAEKGVHDAFVRVDGAPRTNVKITEADSQQTTDINMVGGVVEPQAIVALFEKIDELAESCSWFAFGGRLQDSLPPDLYARLIERLRAAGCRVLLDSSGQPMRLGAAAGPEVLKPNIEELAELVGRPLVGLSDVLAAARGLLNGYTRLVVVSMGEEGALLVREEEALLARPPKVTVQSTVGAGDAMVAGLIAGLRAGLPLADIARLATAFSLCAITRLERKLPDETVLADWQAQVVVERV